jgi:hypothetical protein
MGGKWMRIDEAPILGFDEASEASSQPAEVLESPTPVEFIETSVDMGRKWMRIDEVPILVSTGSRKNFVFLKICFANSPTDWLSYHSTSGWA